MDYLLYIKIVPIRVAGVFMVVSSPNVLESERSSFYGNGRDFGSTAYSSRTAEKFPQTQINIFFHVYFVNTQLKYT